MVNTNTKKQSDLIWTRKKTACNMIYILLASILISGVTWGVGSAVLNFRYQSWIKSPEMQNYISHVLNTIEMEQHQCLRNEIPLSDFVRTSQMGMNAIDNLPQEWRKENDFMVKLCTFILPAGVLVISFIIVFLIRRRQSQSQIRK